MASLALVAVAPVFADLMTSAVCRRPSRRVRAVVLLDKPVARLSEGRTVALDIDR